MIWMNKRGVGFYRGLLSGARRDKRIAESYSICPNLRPQPLGAERTLGQERMPLLIASSMLDGLFERGLFLESNAAIVPELFAAALQN
jgi:hypothetical protein